MGWLTVIEPGMLTTVQDLGRPGHAALGIPPGGAADPLALRVGNRLVGNVDNAAALEITLLGPTLKFESNAVIALTGAETPLPQPPAWASVRVRAGDRIKIDSLTTGARAYLSIGGGINVPLKIGSASTLLSAGFGGHLGRALRAGDRLEFNDAPQGSPDPTIATTLRDQYRNTPTQRTLRAVDGPHPAAFGPAVTRAFWDANFVISNQSNRVGVRLDGSTFSAQIAPENGNSQAGEMVSEGMPLGAIQITPSGQPIALGVDGPTTGGYPVIACIATVDAHLLGQLRPGEKVRFERISLQQARDAFIDRESKWRERSPRS